MKRCALITCEGLDDKILDEDRLERALTAQGWTFQWVPWRQQNVSWEAFDVALIRTPWDYTEDIAGFLQQLKRIDESSCRLINDYSTVVWNSQKTYLTELRDQGIAVIPTQWLELQERQQITESFDVPQIVVKPQVGAGSKNTFSLMREDTAGVDKTFQALQGTAVMIQPFMEKIVSEGEHSAHFFGGEFSHMVLKTPKSNDFRSQEEFGSHVRKVPMTNPQMQFCEKVLMTLSTPPLYARVDFINDKAGQPVLIELELIEPSLYFRYDEEAAPRLVVALEKEMSF